MTPERLARVIATTRIKADSGIHHSNLEVEGLYQEAEHLVERVRVLEADTSEFKRLNDGADAEICELQEQLRVSQLMARSAEAIAGLKL